MRSVLGLAAACLAAATHMVSTHAGAQLPSNSLPAYIADESVLIGKYRYEERADGMKVAVDLNADRTASYRVTSGADDTDFMMVEGVWRLEEGTIHIHNKPGPVRLESARPPTRDLSVNLSVTAKNVDGTPAEGLSVTWEDARGLFVMSGGRHTTRTGENIAARQTYIIRRADRKVLQTLELRPGGPNSFQLTYFPSDVEPFDIPAIALDATGQQIEVELGTASAKLSRVPS